MWREAVGISTMRKKNTLSAILCRSQSVDITISPQYFGYFLTQPVTIWLQCDSFPSCRRRRTCIFLGHLIMCYFLRSFPICNHKRRIRKWQARTIALSRWSGNELTDLVRDCSVICMILSLAWSWQKSNYSFLIKHHLLHCSDKVYIYIYIYECDILILKQLCRPILLQICFRSIRLFSQGITFTHSGRDKMDAISQTTFSSAFSWMKVFESRLKFHWN